MSLSEIQFTLSIIKPDAMRKGLNQKINDYITKAGLSIERDKALMLNEDIAGAFYCAHSNAPFFPELIKLMTSGPVIVQILSGPNAVSVYRQIMGSTNPKEAAKGTIRGDLAETIDENCVHGSDSLANASREIAFFFAQYELPKNYK